MGKTVKEIISKIDDLNEDAVIFSKRVNGKFDEDAEGLLLELTEEEACLPTTEISKMKCPEYEYFLEVFLVKELIEDLVNENPNIDFGQKVKQIVHYAENDCFKSE